MGKIRDILRTMEYGPSPESNEHVAAWLAAHAAGLRPFHRRRIHQARRAFRSRQSRQWQAARQSDAGDGRRHRRGGRGGAHGLRLLVDDAGPCPRAPSLRARPPDPETRPFPRRARDDGQWQADPRIARHRRAAGRAPFLSSRRLGRIDRNGISRPGSGRRLRPDHPVEFPAADAGLEDRARAGGGQHGRPQARRIHAADGARLRRNLPRRRPAAGRRQYRHRRWRDRARLWSTIPASTRSPSPARPRSAASSARRPPAPARNCRSSLAANRPSSSSRTPISTARSKASSMRSGSTRARSAAPVRACWCRKASPNASMASCARAWRHLRVGDPARQIDRHRRHRRADPVAAHRQAGRRGRARRRHGVAAEDRRADAGLLLSADAGHRCRAGLDAGARSKSSARCWSR